MPDFLLALHYLCCMLAILILRAILYIMPCFSARKTTCPCGMMPAAASPCPADPSRAMRTHTLPLRGDIHAWPQAKKSQLLRCVLIATCLCNFDQLSGLAERALFIYLFIFIYNECPYFDLTKRCKSCIAPLTLNTDFLQWTHLASGSWPQLLFLTTPLCKDCNFCHHAFSDAAGHGHAWNKRNPTVTRSKLTCCHPA